MKKIRTLFKKGDDKFRRVINEIDPANKWVFEFGYPTRKFDGTACMILNNEIYKRIDAKNCKNGLPENALPCQEKDPISGSHPHWVLCKETDPADKYFFEAFNNCPTKLSNGTYELCGPKINGNKEKLEFNMLIKHGDFLIEDLEDFEFETIKDYLETHDIEGIVFHHSFNPDKMCKIRKKDFGIKR